MTPDQANRYRKSLYSNPNVMQDDVLIKLISTAKNTQFGKEHNFSYIKNYLDFQKFVPIREYLEFQKYWDNILRGKPDILWPGVPEYFITTSASTGVPKSLPATRQFLQCFVQGVLAMIMQYIYDTNYSIMHGKFMNFTGSLNLKDLHGYKLGPISAILRLNAPGILKHQTLPSQATLELMDSCGWDKMFEQAAKEAIANPITVCSGLPSWMMQFFQACLVNTNSYKLTNVLPKLKLLLTSGVNYRPYLSQFNELFDGQITIREMYGASEGLFAYQDSFEHEEMLLNAGNGIYFEFIELSDKTNRSRVNLSQVKTKTPYVMIISTCSGLWGYKMGDIIEFSSITPYRIKVLGRINHFISIQSEHVYAQHAEAAIQNVNKNLKIDISNFTVVPNNPSEMCIPYHVWYLETPQYHGLNLESLAKKIDHALIESSSGYKKGRDRNSLDKPKVFLLKPGAFLQYLATKNNSSLQLKVPKVCNDRTLADFLIKNDLIINHERSEQDKTVVS